MKKMFLLMTMAFGFMTFQNVSAQTYDFTGNADNTAVQPEWGDAVNVEGQELCYIRIGSKTFDNRFVGQYRTDGKSWAFRDAGDLYKGLWSQYDRYFAVLDLKAGDKVTFKTGANSTLEVPEDAPVITDLLYIGTTEKETAETTLTVEKDGDLLLKSMTSCYIESVTIAAGETNGIVSVSSSNRKDGKCYTLQGTVVEHPEKGIYIMNGKKFIIR